MMVARFSQSVNRGIPMIQTFVALCPLLGLLALPLVPLAAGVAIVRYRLYDIDPIINKALVGGAMVLLIFVGYVSLVVGAGALLPVSDRLLAVAATAVLATVITVGFGFAGTWRALGQKAAPLLRNE